MPFSFVGVAPLSCVPEGEWNPEGSEAGGRFSKSAGGAQLPLNSHDNNGSNQRLNLDCCLNLIVQKTALEFGSFFNFEWIQNRISEETVQTVKVH